MVNQIQIDSFLLNRGNVYKIRSYQICLLSTVSEPVICTWETNSWCSREAGKPYAYVCVRMCVCVHVKDERQRQAGYV